MQPLNKNAQLAPITSLCIAWTTLIRKHAPSIWARIHEEVIDYESLWQHPSVQWSGTWVSLVLAGNLLHGIQTPIEHQLDEEPTLFHEGKLEASLPAEASQAGDLPVTAPARGELHLPRRGNPRR